MAVGIKPGDEVWTTAYSMSATAACAKVLGAHIVFIDIETIRFSLNLAARPPIGPIPKCIIVTNLFGHPAYLSTIRSWCDSNKVIMIEDAAQSPFAMEDGKYAGTVGHIGVFSFNVHKHIQAGEGGIVVTDDYEFSHFLHGAINHGELAGGPTGLNLRMTEPTAAIACVQLMKAPIIIQERIELAETLTDMVNHIPWIRPPICDKGCRHVYYLWAALMDDPEQKRRFGFTQRLQSEGFPMLAGYTKPLHGVFGDHINLPIVQKVEYKQIITFHVCGWSPNKPQLRRMREMIKVAADGL
jgi:dTDP-4-amino-4,6-dideoxygalactose transaminase